MGMVKKNIGPTWTSKEVDVPNLGHYNFNISVFELVAILREMGDKVRWPKEIK